MGLRPDVVSRTHVNILSEGMFRKFAAQRTRGCKRKGPLRRALPSSFMRFGLPPTAMAPSPARTKSDPEAEGRCRAVISIIIVRRAVVIRRAVDIAWAVKVPPDHHNTPITAARPPIRGGRPG